MSASAAWSRSKARALPRQVLLDVDHDLGGECIARENGDGAAKAVAGVTGHQEACRVGDVVLREGDEGVVPGALHGGSQPADDFMLHRRSSWV